MKKIIIILTTIFIASCAKIKEEEEIRMEFPMEKYVCDNSLQPGIVIFTSPPRINCNELPKSPLWLPKPDWKPDWKE